MPEPHSPLRRPNIYMESPHENQPLPPEELNEDDLEFKPVVKYVAIGLALVALFGVEYATYRLGFSNGYNSGVSSEVVSEAVNNAAVKNLTHFMQAATADEATLLHMVQNHKHALSWIKDEVVRREAEWTLASAAMSRGKVEAAAELLKELYPRPAASALWGRRALLTARAFAEAGNRRSAAVYYRYAARVYGQHKQGREQLAAYSELAELLASAADKSEAQLVALEKLQKEVSALGAQGKQLQAYLLAYMGRIHRAHGNSEAALRCFEQALAAVAPDEVPALAGAAVCLGAVLLEKGETQRAEQLLRDGVSRLGEHPGDADYLASALRDLARIELENGNADNALALLYRAEGAAMGRIEAASPYWPCLYDQRGWANFSKDAHEAALVDFTRALAVSGTPEELRAQPLEGAGRCCIALGRAEEAMAHLQEAVQVRNRHFAGDKPALGRVYFSLAQAYDMAGRPREAADTYGSAAANLPQLPGEESDATSAMLGRAYALSQLGDWNAAIQVWSALRSALPRESAHSREVEEQIAHCRRYGATLPEEVDTDEGEHTEAPAQ